MAQVRMHAMRHHMLVAPSAEALCRHIAHSATQFTRGDSVSIIDVPLVAECIMPLHDLLVASRHAGVRADVEVCVHVCRLAHSMVLMRKLAVTHDSVSWHLRIDQPFDTELDEAACAGIHSYMTQICEPHPITMLRGEARCANCERRAVPKRGSRK